MKKCESADISGTQRTENNITTYKERSLHLALKKHFCPDESRHEVRIGSFVADACSDGKIYEIQTANLGSLKKKLGFYLENTDFEVIVVRPLAKDRKILWLDKDSGELCRAPRLSSKHETVADGISDLYYLKEFLGEEKLSFYFVLMEIDEVRLLDGYGKNKKIRSTSVDKVAGEIYFIEMIKNVDDVRDNILSLLPDGEFGRDDLARSLRLKGRKLWSMQKLLTEENLISSEKRGKRLVFKKLTEN